MGRNGEGEDRKRRGGKVGRMARGEDGHGPLLTLRQIDAVIQVTTEEPKNSRHV